MFEAGEQVADFKIVNRLKQGGMATLYLAERGGAGGFAKHCAVKVVHPNLSADPKFVKMFLDESRLTARINHPNVVHVEQLGEVDGAYYLVMEFVHGTSLGTFLQRLAKLGRRFTPEVAVAVAMEVADGLHGAHETRGMRGESLKIVHRDVSPDNVMLAYAGHVKLIDFGIAKSQDGQGKTAGGTIKGKFRYMSPEQAAGLPCDRRSDTYSLALILWEMLTGKQVFEAKEPWMLLQQVREARVVKPSTVVPSLPAKLDPVLLKALAKDPKDRPHTAHDFRRLLAEAMPAALGIDAPHISALLQEVMAKDIANDRARLPVGAQFIPPAKEGTGTHQDEVLKTMTIHAEDIEILGAGDPAAKAKGRRASQRHLPTMKLSSLDDPYTNPSEIVQPDDLERPRRSGRTWLILGGTTVVAGAIAALLVTQSGGEAATPPPAHTASPPTVATADPPPPAPLPTPTPTPTAPTTTSASDSDSASASVSPSDSDSVSPSDSDSVSPSDSDSASATAPPRPRRPRQTTGAVRTTKTQRTTRATTGRRGAVFVDDDF